MKQEAINRILMVHCLSTVANADRILVLENGQITEEGRHEELLSNISIYC